jgi:predicted RNase H-like nuclease (RuvC/YqgF family)
MIITRNRIEDLQQHIIEEQKNKIEELSQENESLAAQLVIEMAKSVEAENRAAKYNELIEEINELKREYLSKLTTLDDLKREFERKSSECLKDIKKSLK